MCQGLNIKRLLKLVTGGFLFLSLLTSTFGQNAGNETASDLTLRGRGRVNPSTLGMEIGIPLGSYPGRGFNVPINLNYSSKLWRMEYTGHSPTPGGSGYPCFPHYRPSFSENSASGWTTSMAVPYIEYLGAQNFYNADGTPFSFGDVGCPTEGGGGSYPYHYIRRLVVHLPGGEMHELRPDDTVKNFPVGSNCNHPNYPCHPDDAGNPANWNLIFYAVDGSNIKYVQNSATNTYRLLMPDGSFYDFDSTTPHGANRKAVKYTDRNGNYITYYAPGSIDDQGVTHPNGYWKDTLGRNISIPLGLQAPTAPTTAGNPQVYSLPGMTGTYKLQWKRLNGGAQAESALTDISDPDYQLKYYGETYVCTNQSGHQTYCTRPAGSFLFSGGDARILGTTLFNPVVLTEIALPNGQKYKFTYDVYARIEKIIYPTGGEETLQYSVVPTLSTLAPTDYVSGQSNFGVTNRKVYKSSGDASPYEWTYSAGHIAPQGYSVIINNPDGTKSERYLHRGNDAGTSLFGYDNGLAGMPYEERTRGKDGKLVARKKITWQKSSYTGGGAASVTADWHPRVGSEQTFFYDQTDNGLSMLIDYEYEDLSQREKPVLQRKSTRYGFVPVPSGSSLSPGMIEPMPAPNPTPCPNGDPPPCIEPPPTPTPTPVPQTPVLITENTFLIYDGTVPQSTKDEYLNKHIIGLVTAATAKSGSGVVASRIETVYDEAGRSPAIGRGNPTTIRVWDSTKGNYDDANAYIKTHTVFDGWGNPTQKTDTKGHTTTIEYDSVHHVFPIKETVAAPGDGTHGSAQPLITETSFDPNAGLPLTVKDINGQVSTMEYDPVTLRLVRVTPPSGAAVVETSYQDLPNNNWVKTRTQIDQTNWTEVTVYFDGLGRPYKSERFDLQGNVTVEREFDEDGRELRVSNPYRSGETKRWTTNFYDAAGRLTKVMAPDGTEVRKDYSVGISGAEIGIVITTTDQAGKKARSITNSLEQLIRVDEPTSTGLGDLQNPNQPTFYSYNTLGKMVKAQQGGQNQPNTQSRYFLYDSLGRLLRVRQPEQNINTALPPLTEPVSGNAQWTTGFTYDDNGNVVTATDSKGVVTQHTYDKLNRIIKREFTVPTTTEPQRITAATSTVTYKYDNLPNGKGKPIEVANGFSTNRVISFNSLGRVTEAQQVTDGVTYNFSYQYNLAGDLIEEKYPSGRKVKNIFTADGSLASVASRVSPVTSWRNFASEFVYTAHGAIEKMRLGNGRWETAKFNHNLQVTELGLGTSATDTSLWKVNYAYGVIDQNGNLDPAKNNGAVARQTITFNGLAAPFVQNYRYDSLDRLIEARETSGSTQTWQQTFVYDHYGNRTSFNQSILGQPAFVANNVTSPTVDQTNNRFATGQGYTYDFNGNLIVDAYDRRFVFDADNKQVEVKDVNNQIVGQYFYDGNGRRVKKVVPGTGETTVFVYSGGKLVAEYSTKIAPQPVTSYLTHDHLGSPRLITDQNGEVISRRDFLPFGEELYAGTALRDAAHKYKPAGDDIRQRFTGYEKDWETGLDFAEARMYNNQHGRFTTVDPLLASGNSANPQTFNRYAYVGNNPVNITDPSGLIWYKVRNKKTGETGVMWLDSRADAPDEWEVLHEWTDYYYKANDGFWYALDPNSGRFAKLFDKESARWAYGLFADYNGDFDDIFDGNFSISGVINTALDARGWATMVSLMKMGKYEWAATQFAYMAGTAGVGGAVGKMMLKALGKVLGSAAVGKLLSKLCCFVAGTRVHTINGLKAIEDIKVGDLVLSWNEQTKQFEYKPVVNVFVGTKQNLVKIRVKGEKKLITTSTEHPFFVRTFHKARNHLTSGDGEDGEEGEYIVAADLKVGQEFLRPDGTWTRITQIKRERRPVTVYNFEVADNHNYFVGEKGLLVHNTCDPTKLAVLKLADAAKSIKNKVSNIRVASREEAEALRLQFFTDQGYQNTSGLTGNMVRNTLPQGKAGTFHWDYGDTMHSGMPHLQVHTFDGDIFRIFFEKGGGIPISPPK